MQDQDIADLVTTTLKDLGRGSFEQIAQDLQQYEVMSKWLKKDRVTFDTGIGIQKTLMDKMATSAQHVGLFEEDVVNIEDVLTTMNITWRQAQTYWAYERREMLRNKGSARILNIITPRRLAAMLGLAATLEDKAWASPAADNEVDPYGIPYWIVKNASDGFNGGAPAGHTTVAGVNLTTHPNFKNYAFTFTAISKASAIAKMRIAALTTNFVSPVSSPENRNQISDKYRIYTDMTNYLAFSDIGEGQNENLGRDIASMDGTVMFHRNPIVWIPKLDADTTHPIYMINHGTFYPVVYKGDYMYEHDPILLPNRHNTWAVWTDLSYQYLCVDRRRNAVGYSTA